MSRHNRFPEQSLSWFRDRVTLHVEVLNEATRDLPSESMRLHLCWGNYDGPHHLDVPIADSSISSGRRGPAAARSRARTRVTSRMARRRATRLPGKVLIPGVIDSTTNVVEHPEVVADRIRLRRYRRAGERLAGSDCGFGTFAGSQLVEESVVWTKLKALRQGADLASKQLWG